MRGGGRPCIKLALVRFRPAGRSCPADLSRPGQRAEPRQRGAMWQRSQSAIPVQAKTALTGPSCRASTYLDNLSSLITLMRQTGGPTVADPRRQKPSQTVSRLMTVNKQIERLEQ